LALAIRIGANVGFLVFWFADLITVWLLVADKRLAVGCVQSGG